MLKIDGCSGCFVRTIKNVCNELGFRFEPNNKKYYVVNTKIKECIGVDSIIDGVKVLDERCSYKIMRENFLKV